MGAAACCWLLVFLGSSADPDFFLSAFALHDGLVVWAAAVVLLTGLGFALLTPWGLVRHWWIVGKWVGLGLLGLGIPLVVVPVINSLAAHADLARATGVASPDISQLRRTTLGWLTLEILLLVALFALSAWKPRRESRWRLEERRYVRPLLFGLAALAVGSSLVQSARLHRARHTPLERSSARHVQNGLYRGEIRWLGASPVVVEVRVEDERVVALALVEQPAGLYPSLAARVSHKVEHAGDLEVDGVTGATTSARAILVAASRALAAAEPP